MDDIREKLKRMTVANGCTPAEARVAKKKLEALDKDKEEEESPERLFARKVAESRAALAAAQKKLDEEWEHLQDQYTKDPNEVILHRIFVDDFIARKKYYGH